jgi:hypothetical protein
MMELLTLIVTMCGLSKGSMSVQFECQQYFIKCLEKEKVNYILADIEARKLAECMKRVKR